MEHINLNQDNDILGTTLGEALLAPTKIYVSAILALKEQVKIKALSHITGGGFYENIPRSLPEGCCAKIQKSLLKIPPIFRLLQQQGDIPERDMFNTFNMGIGMTAVISKEEAALALQTLRAAGEEAYIIGEIAAGEKGVEIW